MEWFKHKTASIDDPDIIEAEDRFGESGYNVFFKILEVYGDEFKKVGKDGNLRISKRVVGRKLRKRWSRVELILKYYQTKLRIFSTTDETDENYVFINIPDFIALASNWTRRPKKEPTEAPTEAPTAIEVEEEVEKEEIRTLIEGYTPPTPDEIENSAKPKIQKDLSLICKVLYYSKIFTDAPKFINTMKKRIKNNRTILHTMVACYRKKEFEGENGAWAYCMQIIKIEDGNFNERDNTKNS